MNMSLAAEPRRRGLFEPYFWSRASTSHTALSLLNFPEPLPSLTLIDRTTVASSGFPFLHGIDTRLRQGSFGQKCGATSSSGLGLGGTTVIPVYNGDLLLAVQQISASDAHPPQSSRPPSSVNTDGTGGGPPSRSPSVRVKTGSSQALDRKSSVVRRSSLPAISQRQSFIAPDSCTMPSTTSSLRVTVQAGSLDVLVGILVHGLQENVAVSVADDNGEVSLRGEKRARELVLDRTEFGRVWWRAFRSFVSPFVFFEVCSLSLFFCSIRGTLIGGLGQLLRKRYINAHPNGQPPSTGEPPQVTRQRVEVLETIKEWLTRGGGCQDALDDSQLYDAISMFLKKSPQNPAVDDTSEAWVALNEARDALVALLYSSTMRPTPMWQSAGASVTLTPARGTGERSFGKDPPDVDLVDAELLVGNLDAIAGAVFGGVSEEVRVSYF
jgi:GTPase-activating protein BEM2